jgi:hypothetical protein
MILLMILTIPTNNQHRLGIFSNTWAWGNFDIIIIFLPNTNVPPGRDFKEGACSHHETRMWCMIGEKREWEISSPIGNDTQSCSFIQRDCNGIIKEYSLWLIAAFAPVM